MNNVWFEWKMLDSNEKYVIQNRVLARISKQGVKTEDL